MKKLGKVSNKTRDGLIVVQSILKDPRRLVGALVYDEDLKKIGKIIDVIGRIDSPYVVIKPITHEYVELLELGSNVYYRIEKKTKRYGKKGRKKRGGGRRKRRKR